MQYYENYDCVCLCVNMELEEHTDELIKKQKLAKEPILGHFFLTCNCAYLELYVNKSHIINHHLALRHNVNGGK